MNSEELELSLRTEFENYLKDVVDAMRKDVTDFKKSFETEFEKHKSQMDEAFRDLSTRFDSEFKFDQAFTESVVEHLRLARDDGARLTAQAFSDAEKLEESSAAPSYDKLRDAINEITGQGSQSAILRSLVDQTSQFAARGAFFILKHDNFVCWRRFDENSHADDESVRGVHFPLEADTLLADSVRSLATRQGSGHSEDPVYLDALGFERSDRMFAVPLVARGRGVAVLFVDGDVNLEAVESLVRVAGLTVELRAAAAAPQPATEAPSDVPVANEEVPPVTEGSHDVGETVEEVYETESPTEVEEYGGDVSVEEPEVAEEVPVHVEQFETAPAVEYPEAAVEEASEEPEYQAVEVAEPSPQPEVNDFAFASNESYDASAAASEPETAHEPTEEYAYAGDTAAGGANGHTYESTPEPIVEVAAAQPSRSRLSDRNVDLPIEVSDEERRLHNDARRFARLLVSEIKLYNEQKVSEGRDAGDLYDRLREAIDRSREMYDKRVKPEVAAKFDYFHYELVGNLAEGNDAKLGASYPGASV